MGRQNWVRLAVSIAAAVAIIGAARSAPELGAPELGADGADALQLRADGADALQLRADGADALQPRADGADALQPRADGADALPKAFIDGVGLGWRDLTGEDFTNVNVDPGTFTWKGNGFDCTGAPVGVIRSKKPIVNFELVARWRHLKDAGNAGIFLWGVEESLNNLKRNQLPQGIEVQVLDTGYTASYEKQTGKKADWFTTHGDVFPCAGSKMTPFPPVAPDGQRSFPRKNLSKPSPQWNHYYVRAINGEVRLWVNGEEVSGGKDCSPRTGYLCLESEGSPTEFRDMRIRELP